MDNYTYLKPVHSFLPIAGVIWAVFGGFVLGLLMSYYHKTYIGEVIRRLLKKDAVSEGKALTLKELGLNVTKLRAFSLKRGRFLRRYVEVANSAETEIPLGKKERRDIFKNLFPSKEKYKYDFDSMKLFVPEEKKYTADVRFEQKSRLSPVAVIILAAILIGAAAASTFLIPNIIKIADNFISSILNK